MNAVPAPDPGVPSPDPQNRTLGDLLYAERPRSLVPESDWVALVRSVGRGDQLALRELFERSHGLVYTFILGATRSRQSAEELTLEIFRDLWMEAVRYNEDECTVLAWLMRHVRSRITERIGADSRADGQPPTGGTLLEGFRPHLGGLGAADQNTMKLGEAHAMGSEK